MKIAFVGAGQMGMPMVHRLVAAGRDVTVYARRSEVRDECAATGASVTDEASAAVADADLAIVCLYADDQLHDLAAGTDGVLAAMKPGATFVSHTTGSPGLLHDLAAANADRDIHVVDTPVSGSADDIAAGHVTVLLGGDPTDLERVAPVVGAYGDPVITLGPLGSGLTVKLLNNALFAAHVQLIGEIDRIASSLGIDVAAALAAIGESSGSSYALGTVERMGSVSAMAEAAGHFLHKDVATVQAVAAKLGVDLGELGHINDHGPLTFAERA